MRNQMATDLGPRENLVDDDNLRRRQQRPAGTPLESEAVSASIRCSCGDNRPAAVVIADGESITDTPLHALRLIHDDGNTMTFTVKYGRGSSEPATLIFSQRRSAVAQFLRQQASDASDSDKRFGGLRDRLRT